MITLLEAYFTPEEGEVVMELFDPITCQEVASRMDVDENKISPILESLTALSVIKGY